MNPVRVFIAEDHSVVREGLKLLINAQADMEVVGEAGDGEEALRGALECAPDVVVMDISMPALGGREATVQLKAARSEAKVLALSVHEDRGYLRDLFSAGVSGYVLKRSAAEQLIQAIRMVAEGGVYLDPAMVEKFVDRFVHEDSPETALADREEQLSGREREVLQAIARGLTIKEIATAMNVSVKTVETYKARGMTKAGLNSRVDIVRLAIHAGWLKDDR